MKPIATVQFIRERRRAFIAATGIVVGLVLIGGAFFGGVRYGAAYRSVNITDSKEILNADFSLFWEALDRLKQKYVHADELKDQDLLYGAVRGAVEATGDPYTTFFKPSDAEKFDQDLSGSFGGIGAQIGVRNEQLLIITPLKESPAEEAGLKASDKILKIDDKTSTNLAAEEAVKLIRGEPGTTVRLLIFRDGWKDAKEISIVRQIIEVPTVDWKMRTLPDGATVLHLQLYNFNSNAPELFFQAVVGALASGGGARGVVLDLRNNPGGFLDVAVHFAGWFLDHGAVVAKERFRDGAETVFRANGNGAFSKIPVVVLVNGGSASAAEILAGALRDIRGIKLVGEKTFGKGSVQEMDALSDGSELKVTIAEWLTPDGVQINERGLVPDVEVKSADNGDGKDAEDVQLERALEVLESEMRPELTWSVVDVKTE